MKIRLAFFVMMLVVAFAPAARCQQVMDKSALSFENGLVAEMTFSLIGKTPDPFSSQFVLLRAATDHAHMICGLVNVKGSNGGYVGFQPFVYNSKSKSVTLSQSAYCK